MCEGLSGFEGLRVSEFFGTLSTKRLSPTMLMLRAQTWDESLQQRQPQAAERTLPVS